LEDEIKTINFQSKKKKIKNEYLRNGNI